MGMLSGFMLSGFVAVLVIHTILASSSTLVAMMQTPPRIDVSASIIRKESGVEGPNQTVVITLGCTPYQNWQSVVAVNSLKAIRAEFNLSFEIVRLVACSNQVTYELQPKKFVALIDSF